MTDNSFLFGAASAIFTLLVGAALMFGYGKWKKPSEPVVINGQTTYFPRTATLPSTNWQIWVATWLGVVTVIVVDVCLLIDRDLQENILYQVFLFILGLGGIGAYQFKKKRESSEEHFKGLAAVEAAKKPPAPTQPSNVTVANEVTQVQPGGGT